MPTGTSFMNFQRFVNIYDGPFYQDGSVFLDIKRSPLTDCKPAAGQCSIRLNQCTADDQCAKICSGNRSADCMDNAFCANNGWGTCESLQKCTAPDSNTCLDSEFMWGRSTGVRYNPDADPMEQCYLPNAAIAWKQQNEFGHHTDLSFGNPEWTQLAEAFGWHGHFVADAAALAGTLDKALAEQGPSLVVIPIDYRENPLLTKKLGEITCTI